MAGRGALSKTPQAQHQIGLKVQTREAVVERQLLDDDALALEQAGAFAVLLEVVPVPLAEAITKRLSIPVIGIGAGHIVMEKCRSGTMFWAV